MSVFAYSILSIDGGGIRGIIPCMVLDKIESRVAEMEFEAFETAKKVLEAEGINTDNMEAPTKLGIAQLFDLIAGTSTGGMLAAGLTVTVKDSDAGADAVPKLKNTANDLLELYKGDNGKKIFKKPLGLFGKLPFLLKLFNLTRSLFPSKNIEDVLWDEFQDARLREVYTDLIITSYDTINNVPYYFESTKAKEAPKEHDFEIREMCRATSAAPTYFPPKELTYTADDSKTKKLSLIDGGVFANNPSVLAYVKAMKIWKKDDLYTKQFKKTTSALLNDKGIAPDIVVDNYAPPILFVSIGTGRTKKYYPHEDKGWGLVKAASIIDILMQGVSESVDYQMNDLLPRYETENIDEKGNKIKEPRYFRLNINVPAEFAEMSDTSQRNIDGLVDCGNKLLLAHKTDIDKICKHLLNIKNAQQERRDNKRSRELSVALADNVSIRGETMLS